jgi:hypothetical protein
MNSVVKSLVVLGLAGLCAPAFAANPARPGTVNYIEGTAFVDGRQVNQQDIGSLDLDAGQVLSTGQGKAEILLTPGVFLRVDANSAVKMIAPDLTLTQVEVDRGKAGVEADQILKENNIEVVEDGVSTRLEKNGYYEFNADRGAVKTFSGEAAVELADGRTKQVKGDHEFTLTAAANARPLAKEKAVSFDKQASEDDLYNWSRLRSQYLAEANNQIAGEYYGPGFYPGWYWDPYAWDYTFLGAGPFWSPFGWGFYPLGWGWGGWYGGFYGHPFYGRGFAGGFQGGFAGGGFHGGFGGGARGR